MVYNEKDLKEKMQEEKQNIVLPPKKETIGEILKKKREEFGLDLDRISNDLRIKSQYLLALENNEFQSLPGSAYVIGFIKTYATYLKLDANAIVSQYKQETNKIVVEQDLVDDENSLIKDPVINSNHLIIGGFIVVLGIIFVSLLKNSNQDNNPVTENEDVKVEVSKIEEIPSSQNLSSDIVVNDNNSVPVVSNLDYFETNIEKPAVEESPVVETTVVENSLPAETVAEDIVPEPVKTEYVPKEYGLVNKDSSEISIKATKKVWVKLKKDGFYKYDAELGDIGTGVSVFETILEPGDIYYIPEGDNYFLTIGNAQGLDIVVDGEVIKPLSNKEVSRHNVEMDVEKLKNGTAYVRNRVIE